MCVNFFRPLNTIYYKPPKLKRKQINISRKNMISFLDLGFSIPFSSQSQLGVGKRKCPDTTKDFWKVSGQNLQTLKARLPLQPVQTEMVPCTTEATCYGGGGGGELISKYLLTSNHDSEIGDSL